MARILRIADLARLDVVAEDVESEYPAAWLAALVELPPADYPELAPIAEAFGVDTAPPDTPRE